MQAFPFTFGREFPVPEPNKGIEEGREIKLREIKLIKLKTTFP